MIEVYFFFFFFQAEDGIRDLYVTGVQTCALPILLRAQHLDGGEQEQDAAGDLERAERDAEQPEDDGARHGEDGQDDERGERRAPGHAPPLLLGIALGHGHEDRDHAHGIDDEEDGGEREQAEGQQLAHPGVHVERLVPCRFAFSRAIPENFAADEGCRRMRAQEQVPAAAPASEAQPLALSEDRFRALVEQSIAGIYVIQDGRVVYANPKFCEIFGYSREEFAQGGVPLEQLTCEQDWPMVRENVRRRLAGEVQSMHYTFRARRKDGAPIEVEVHGARTELAGNLAITGTLLDITERRREIGRAHV